MNLPLERARAIIEQRNAAVMACDSDAFLDLWGTIASWTVRNTISKARKICSYAASTSIRREDIDGPPQKLQNSPHF